MPPIRPLGLLEDQEQFRGQFDESIFPDPQTGLFSSMVFYDNSDTNGDGVNRPG